MSTRPDTGFPVAAEGQRLAFCQLLSPTTRSAASPLGDHRCHYTAPQSSPLSQLTAHPLFLRGSPPYPQPLHRKPPEGLPRPDPAALLPSAPPLPLATSGPRPRHFAPLTVSAATSRCLSAFCLPRGGSEPPGGGPEPSSSARSSSGARSMARGRRPGDKWSLSRLPAPAPSPGRPGTGRERPRQRRPPAAIGKGPGGSRPPQAPLRAPEGCRGSGGGGHQTLPGTAT